MRSLRTLVSVCLVGLAFPALAAAQDRVPDDNGAGDQYLPSVTNVDGNKPEPYVKNDASKQTDEVPEPLAGELQQGSTLGAEVAAAAAATAPQSDELDSAKAGKAERKAERRWAERRAERRADRRERQELRQRREARQQAEQQSEAASAGLGASDDRIGVLFPLLLGVALAVALGRRLLLGRASADSEGTTRLP